MPLQQGMTMELTKLQKSLLIYLETCAVDTGGLVIGARMNKEDFQIVEIWKNEGFLNFGRIAMADIQKDTYTPHDHWVELSEKAWQMAHQLRIERADRKSNSVSKERLGYKKHLNLD